MLVMWKEVTPDRKVLPIGENYNAVSVPNVRFLHCSHRGHTPCDAKICRTNYPWRLKLKTDAK